MTYRKFVIKDVMESWTHFLHFKHVGDVFFEFFCSNLKFCRSIVDTHENSVAKFPFLIAHLCHTLIYFHFDVVSQHFFKLYFLPLKSPKIFKHKEVVNEITETSKDYLHSPPTRILTNVRLMYETQLNCDCARCRVFKQL